MSELTAETLTTADIDALFEAISLETMEGLNAVPLPEAIATLKAHPDPATGIEVMELAIVAWERAIGIITATVAYNRATLDGLRG